MTIVDRNGSGRRCDPGRFKSLKRRINLCMKRKRSEYLLPSHGNVSAHLNMTLNVISFRA